MSHDPDETAYDPGTRWVARKTGQTPSDALRQQLETEPTPGERFGTRASQVLREAAERLDRPRD